MPKEDFEPATPQAVDAYKTYLFRKGTVPVSQVESIKPGTVISTDILDQDIEATAKTIATCESLDFPAYEELNKLKGLKVLRQLVAGKTWPTPKQVYESLNSQEKSWLQSAFQSVHNVAEEAAKLQKDEQKQALLLAAKQDLAEQQGKNWTGPKYKKPPQKLKPHFKPYTPEQLFEKAHGKPADTSSGITQKVMMLMGMYSNCNVSVYTKYKNYELNPQVTLQCIVCTTTRILIDQSLFNSDKLTAEAHQFCVAHRHGPAHGVPEVVKGGRGRLFRDED